MQSVVVGVRAPESKAREAGVRAPAREVWVDVFRGLLIAHMALDHASLMFNRGRYGEELAAAKPAIPDDVLQFATRALGMPVAPAFCFIAGFMVATTSLAREARGVPPAEVSRRLVVRGLVLLGVDAFVMGLPRLLMGFYSFNVLSAIGVSLVGLAFLRRLPSRALLPAALAVLFLHPLLDVSSLPTPLRAVLYEPVRAGSFRSLYPVVPWGAVVVVGFVVGRDAAKRGDADASRRWAVFGLVSLVVFLAVRFAGGFGNAYDYTSPWRLDFWLLAKYPPDLAFLSLSFSVIFFGLAVLRGLSGDGLWGLRFAFLAHPLVVFGRVPFFFYVVHFFVLGLARGALGGGFGLGATYGVWLALLAVMARPCAWYWRRKQQKPSVVTRYL